MNDESRGSLVEILLVEDNPGDVRLTKEAIFEAAGVPSMIFDLDGVDSREYDPEATKANLDSFVETLLARKGK